MWVGLLFLLINSWPVQWAGPLTGRIEGDVRLLTGGTDSDPFEDVPVRLEYVDHGRSRLYNTDAEGKYIFDSLPLGDYVVRPEKKGYKVRGGQPYAEATVSIDKTEVVIPPFYLAPL